MARIFDITTTMDVLNLDASGKGTLIFTLTNISAKPQRGTLRVRALDSGQLGWLSIAGETERDFPPGLTQQVEVRVAVPTGTAPGKFRIRLDGLSVAAPEEDFAEGPAIAVVLTAPKEPEPTKIPWWVWLIVGLVVLIIVGVVAFQVLRKPPAPTPKPPEPAPSAPQLPGREPPPTTPATREFNDPRVAVPEGRLPLDVCLAWGTSCGKPAADAYCRANGMGGAVDFRIAMDSPPTVVFSTKQVCRDPSCDRITWINCSVQPAVGMRLNPETLIRLQALPAKGKQLSVE